MKHKEMYFRGRSVGLIYNENMVTRPLSYRIWALAVQLSLRLGTTPVFLTYKY